MNKIFSLLFIAFLLFNTGCKKDNQLVNDDPSSKPNILLIIADDIGIEATPGYGIGNIKPAMQNLEGLAANGIVFENFWSYPVCSPTRSSILTGRYGYRTGVLNAENASTISSNEKTIQSYLNENTNSAYSHSIIGKWHLSNNEPERPTQMGVGYYAGLLGGGVSDYYNWQLTENGQSSNYSGYITTKITDLAIDWISQQTKPWFSWVAYTAPHTPFHLPPSEMHSQGALSANQDSIDANPMPYFMAMVESIDFEIGRLIESIPSQELENTVIIFIGDNGSHPRVIQAPYESTRSKGSLYQGGIHVPMIISGYQVSRINERDNSLISSTDLFATIAELAGITLPIYEDSYSFKPLLASPNSETRDYNYSEVLNTNLNKSGYTVRDSRYKFIEFDNGRRRFYDLSVDPYEQNNLLNGSLTTDQNSALQNLITQANSIRQ